jgi:glycosyltransferase involved in cell wall biosynthesis
MKILVLAAEVPATTNLPGSPRLFSLCKVLSATHRLTLVTFANGLGRHRRFLDDPSAAGVFEDIVILPAPPEPRWWGQQLHRLRQEVHFATRLRNRRYLVETARRISSLVKDGGFDVLYADGLANAQYVDESLPSPAVMDLHDCVTLLYARKTRAERDWVKKLQLYLETRSITRWEKTLSRGFQAIIVNSKVDESHLKALDPTANTLTIGNGVDGDFFRSTGGEGDFSKLVFTGVMDYGPNEDAALFFVQEILPLIQASHPAVQVSIVGKSPTERVQALAARPGVRVTGEVPDVRPFLEEAGVFVSPLRWGAGVKNKLLAALAMEKAVVATRTSIEGLDLQADVHLLVADEPADFAAKVARLIMDPIFARRLARAGHQRVTKTYSWQSSGRLLEETLLGLVAGHNAKNSFAGVTR